MDLDLEAKRVSTCKKQIIYVMYIVKLLYVQVQNFLWFQILLCSLTFKGQKEMKKIKPHHLLCKLVHQCFVYLSVCLFVYLLIFFNLTEVSYKK